MRLNIVVADDQADHLPKLRNWWESAIGVGPNYEVMSDIEAVERKMTSRPHVVVIDNNFSNASNEGATFIARTKVRHPDTIFVLMTSKLFDIEQLGQRVPNPDFIVPKSYLLNDKYREYIGNAIREALTRTPVTVATPADGLSETGITPSAFNSLVEQCLSSLEILDFDLSAPPHASFSMLSGGYSGAAVYQVSVRGAGKTPSLPLVLKCGSRIQISREVSAFERWVRWQIPNDMRVDVIGKGTTGDHAAVCYGFVLGSSTELKSLHDVIAAEDQAAVEKTLNRLFFAERTGWYAPARKGSRSLCEYLFNTHEFTPQRDDRRNTKLHETLQRLNGLESFSYATTGADFFAFGKPVSSIRRALEQVDVDCVRLTYCHGDLNSRNVFLDGKTDGLALIDFEQAGENHIFRDFVSIETSIRMDLPERLTSGISFADLVALEEDLCEKSSNVTKTSYSEWIAMVRSLSKKRHPDSDTHEYLIPLLLHSWKVLGIKSWPSEIERRLAASILAMLRCLVRR